MIFSTAMDFQTFCEAVDEFITNIVKLSSTKTHQHNDVTKKSLYKQFDRTYVIDNVLFPLKRQR